MKRPIKIALYAVGGLIVLIVLVVIVAVTVIDPNAYKGQIERIATQQVGRELRIGGDIDLSFFPWIGVSIHDVALANAKGFPAEQFATVRSLGVKVKLLPLLTGDIQVGGVQLSGFTLNLTRNEKGRTNWEGLAAKTQPKPAAEPTGRKQPTAVPAVSVQKVDIAQGTVNWTDRAAGTILRLREVDLTAGPVQPAEPFSFTFGFRMENEKPQVSMRVRGSGQARADMQKQQFGVKGFELSARFQGPAVPAGEGELEVAADASLDLAARNATVDPLSVKAYGANLSGSATGTSILEEPVLEGRMALAELNPKKLMQRMGLSPLATRDKAALTSARASMRFRGSPKTVRISNLQAKLDETSVSGRIEVKNPASPAIDLAMQLDTLNVDRYMPPAEGKAEPATKDKAEPRKKEGGAIPTEPLRKLDLDGQIDIGELVVRKMRLHNVSLTLSAHDGVVDVIPLKADLYGGKLHTTTTLDVRKKTPSMRMNHKLNSVDLDPLLQDLVGLRLLTGKTDMEAALDTAGQAPGEWLKNVGGDLSFLVDEGTIRGLNIPGLLRNTLRTLTGKGPEAAEEKTTDFTRIEASAKLQEGIARQSTFSLLSPLLRLTGSGSVNLIEQIVDYSLQAKLTDKFKQQSRLDLGSTGSLDIPISLSGSLTDPKYTVDAKGLIRDLGRDKLKEQVQEKFLDKLDGGGSQQKQDTDQSPRIDPRKMLEGVFQK